MLPVDSEVIRLFLHVLAACVWVGGQLVLAGLVPALRSAGDATVVRAAARRFNLLAWPAYGVLLATGIWNILEQPDDTSTAYSVTFGVKMIFVVASGVAAFVHATRTSRLAVAAGGGVGFVGGLVALFLGTVLDAQGPFG